jgi:hypothetical protein
VTLLFMDGFDHYTVSQLGLKWSLWTGYRSTLDTTGGRFGGGAFRVTDGGGFTMRPFPQSATWVVGCAFKQQTRIESTKLIVLRDNASDQFSIGQDANGYVTAWVGSSVLGSGTTPMGPDTWYYLELKVTIGNSGSWDVKLNGVTQTSGSGDTQATANAYADRLMLISGTSSTSKWFDDVYVADSGDFLGDCRVETLFPSGNGNSSQWVGSDADSTDNYLLVDETTPSTSDYVDGSNSGDKDTYAFGDLTSTSGTVYGVQIVPYAAKTDAGTRSIASVARLSGTEVDSADETLSASAAYYPDVRETKPGGGAWTISDVNSAEFGVKVTA